MSSRPTARAAAGPRAARGAFSPAREGAARCVRGLAPPPHPSSYTASAPAPEPTTGEAAEEVDDRAGHRPAPRRRPSERRGQATFLPPGGRSFSRVSPMDVDCFINRKKRVKYFFFKKERNGPCTRTMSTPFLQKMSLKPPSRKGRFEKPALWGLGPRTRSRQGVTVAHMSPLLPVQRRARRTWLDNERPRTRSAVIFPDFSSRCWSLRPPRSSTETLSEGARKFVR